MSVAMFIHHKIGKKNIGILCQNEKKGAGIDRARVRLEKCYIIVSLECSTFVNQGDNEKVWKTVNCTLFEGMMCTARNPTQ